MLEEENPQRDPQPSDEKDPQLVAIEERIVLAEQRLLNAAIAFCDGSISAGQLRAVRELLREQEARADALRLEYTPPFVEGAEPSGLTQDPEVVNISDLQSNQAGETLLAPRDHGEEMTNLMASLDEKVDRLEQDYQQGRINAAQYRAIRRHYLEQREVAVQLRQTHPESDRWRVVLEEGKTTFLMQLHEASVRYVSFFDIRSRNPIFEQGGRPQRVGEAVSLLRTFSGPRGSTRMLAAHTDDGDTMLLIPGRYTAALISFSQDPPAWQIRALREVHRNFEAANRVVLERGERRGLVFPDMTRFIKEND